MEISEEKLTQLLKEAKEAHHEYEKTLEGSDNGWAKWYADYIHRQVQK